MRGLGPDCVADDDVHLLVWGKGGQIPRNLVAGGESETRGQQKEKSNFTFHTAY
jgi:hypothetical protein